jgi:hypothetical protein
MAMTASEIVAIALAMDPVERAAYVRQACGSDRRLLEETDALLIAHTAVTATIAVGGSDVSFGTPIGPYKLIRQIGEGGMAWSTTLNKRTRFVGTWRSRSSNQGWTAAR